MSKDADIIGIIYLLNEKMMFEIEVSSFRKYMCCTVSDVTW